jgi:hypothetical protein
MAESEKYRIAAESSGVWVALTSCFRIGSRILPPEFISDAPAMSIGLAYLMFPQVDEPW